MTNAEYVADLVQLLQSPIIHYVTISGLYRVGPVDRFAGSATDTIVYPVGQWKYKEFVRKDGFGAVAYPPTPLPDTIETRFAYWYVTCISSRYDVRTMSDNLIALLVHARDTGETWALEDYLTEEGIL